MQISAKWHLLGSQLGVSFNFRQGLRTNNESNEYKLEATLNEWLESATSTPTWFVLINALKGAGLNECAQNVKEHLRARNGK